jgi:chitin synthase
MIQNSLDSLGPAWKYVNIPLQYGYGVLLLLCFLLSLGNRPAGLVYSNVPIGSALIPDPWLDIRYR